MVRKDGKTKNWQQEKVLYAFTFANQLERMIKTHLIE